MENTQPVAFVYGTPQTALAAVPAAVAQGVINITSEADFQAMYITGTAFQAGLNIPAWGGLVTIQDEAPSRILMNVPISWIALVGTGLQPLPLDPPRKFRAGSTVTVTFTNSAAGVATICQLVFIGNKLFNDAQFRGL